MAGGVAGGCAVGAGWGVAGVERADSGVGGAVCGDVAGVGG